MNIKIIAIHLFFVFWLFISCHSKVDVSETKVTLTPISSKKVKTPDEIKADSALESRIDKYKKAQAIEELATKEAVELAAKNSWESSKAGKIQKNHPNWTKEDCESVAKKFIWIGMTYEMLAEIKGDPDDENSSNYGAGIEWQWCWNKGKPSCFYSEIWNKTSLNDLKIRAYN